MSNACSPAPDLSTTVGTPLAGMFGPPSFTMATSWLPTVPQKETFGNRTVAGNVAENRGEMSTEVHEEIIEAPPEDVWGFMVDPAALSAWFGADAWLEPEPEGIVRFRFAGGAERRGRVEHVAPFRSLTWRWRE